MLTIYSMGLYMVKKQVESMGGTIRVESEVNKGTEFIIEFGLNDVQISNNIAHEE